LMEDPDTHRAEQSRKLHGEEGQPETRHTKC
jgi:hypothetical protein